MNPFEWLEMAPSFDVDLEELDRRYRRLQRVLHPDSQPNAPAHERHRMLSRAVSVNEAYRTLKDDVGRAGALLDYVSGGSDATQPDADPAFLMEVMELREALADARRAKSRAQLGQLQSTVNASLASVHDGLRREFARAVELRNAGADVPDELQRGLQTLVGKLKYFRRFVQEAQIVQEDILS